VPDLPGWVTDQPSGWGLARMTQYRLPTTARVPSAQLQTHHGRRRGAPGSTIRPPDASSIGLPKVTSDAVPGSRNSGASSRPASSDSTIRRSSSSSPLASRRNAVRSSGRSSRDSWYSRSMCRQRSGVMAFMRASSRDRATSWPGPSRARRRPGIPSTPPRPRPGDPPEQLDDLGLPRIRSRAP
jgi:hypothetical protein